MSSLDNLFPAVTTVKKPLRVVIDFRDSPFTKIVNGIPSADEARGVMEAVGKQWAASKKGRGWKNSPQNGLEIIFTFSDGKQAGTAYIEPMVGDGTGPGALYDSRKPRGPETGRTPA